MMNTILNKKQLLAILLLVHFGFNIRHVYADIYIDINQADAYVISSQPNEKNDYIQLISPVGGNINHAPNITGLPYHQEVVYAAKATQLDPALIHAVIAAESNHNVKAISSKGAAGLMQLMPKTAKKFDVSDLFDAKQNILAGSQYLSELSQTYHGDLTLTLAAYNAGPASIKKYGGSIPPYQETQHYVPKVLKLYKGFTKKLKRLATQSFS